MLDRVTILALPLSLLALLAPCPVAVSQGEALQKACTWDWVNGVYVETCPPPEIATDDGAVGPFPGADTMKPNDLVQDIIESGKFTSEQILILEGLEMKAY